MRRLSKSLFVTCVLLLALAVISPTSAFADKLAVTSLTTQAATTQSVESEPNETLSAANSQKLNTEVHASMAATDEDWYVFSIPTSGTYSLSFASDGGVGGTAFYYELLDNNRENKLYKPGVSTYKSFSDYTSSSHSIYLPSGVAYLHVYLGNHGSNNSGNYRFKLYSSGADSSLSDGDISSSNKAITSYESESNDALRDSNIVQINTEIQASMASVDEDWFVFKIPVTGTYTLSFASDGGVGGTAFYLNC